MKTDHIKKRNMLMQIVLVVVTFGIYIIYWYYATLKELHIANGNDGGVLLWAILSMFPVLNFPAKLHYSSEFNSFSQDKYPTLLVFLLFVVFSPAVWFIAQSDLNRAADGARSSGLA